MAIAQLNWGQLRFPLSDPRMAEFNTSLAKVYRLAETHHGFIWRIPDADAKTQLQVLGFGEQTSSTVSVWQSVEALKDYTFNSLHGTYIDRAAEWFEKVEGPQLVIWDVDMNNHPSFKEAFDRLETFKKNGASAQAYGWPK